MSYHRITERIIPAAGNRVEPHYYEFIDENVVPGQEHFYRLVEISAHGDETVYGPVSVLVAPIEYVLEQNRPNPFTEATTISLHVPAQGPVQLAVYDLGGRLVQMLYDGALKPGVQTFEWDGAGRSGKAVVNVVYCCVVEAEKFKQIRRMILTR